MFAHGSVCLRSCNGASVPCSVDKPVDRTLIQHGEEDNLLDVPIIVSKRGRRNREELVESEKVYISETVFRGTILMDDRPVGWHCLEKVRI